MHIVNVFMLHQTVKTSVSQWESDFHTCPLPEVLEGDSSTFKGLGDILFLFEGEDVAPFCRATCCNEAVLAGRQPGSSPGPGLAGFGHFLIHSFFILSQACLPGE